MTQNKVCLITGAARRIGACIAEVLHDNNFNIIIHYNNSDKSAVELKNKLNKIRPDSAEIIKFDLLDLDNLEKLIIKSQTVWNSLDCLIHNASVFNPEPSEINLSHWQGQINTNLTAPYLLSNYFKKYCNPKAHIINITDIHGEKPLKDYTAYCVSKSGLVMLTKSLAKQWGPEIQVNAVAPGAIIWPEGESELASNIKQDIVNKSILKKSGEPSHIAQSVLFLLNHDFITGEILHVDGGRLL